MTNKTNPTASDLEVAEEMALKFAERFKVVYFEVDDINAKLLGEILKATSKNIAQALADNQAETERKTAEDIHRKQESDFENSGCVNEACRHCELWDESIQAIKSKYLNQAREGGEGV